VLNNATGLTLDYIIIWLLLLVPFWPLLRGQSWANHKHALGWTRGKGFIREIFAGVVGYLALLPIFIVGVLFTLLLTILFAFVERIIAPDAPSEPLTHPIMEQLAGGDFKTLLLLLSLAALWAPLVEETIFRGALYHHVRAKWRAAMSGLFVGFVFAVIHPQGFAAIPALMSLGFSFALLREWRGSLIAPITAHAMHNGFLVTMLWLALS
jgi:membrane protease YdiL (CAAX protease family)